MRFVVKPNYSFAQFNDRFDGVATEGVGTRNWAAGSSRGISKASTAPTVVSALPQATLIRR
ncbi:MAG: hypothetical protein J2P17_29015 [Mycobacterium sp.]|nr:hypothetical protein [Mycobacterium sp.]